MILVDTSGLLAAIDASQARHVACAGALRAARPPRILSPFVLAELDYLLATRVGSHAQRAFLSEVATEVYRLESFSSEDVEQATSVLDRYEDLDLGLADASIVVLAGRYRARDLLTLDERHFRVVRRPNGRQFRILPADSAD